MRLEKEGRTRGARGLGPFTGGQLTVLLLAAMFVIGAPVGAYAAVSGSNAFITDHSSGVHATVATGGNLQTDARAPAGGTVVVADVFGAQNSCSFFVVPAGKAFVVTGVQLRGGGATGGATLTSGNDVFVAVTVDSETACGASYGVITAGQWASDSSEYLPFDPGIGLKAGSRVDMLVGGAANGFLTEVYLYGYYESSSACGSACTLMPRLGAKVLTRLVPHH